MTLKWLEKRTAGCLLNKKKHKVVIFISNLFKTRNLLRILFTPVYSLTEIQIRTTVILAKP